jgi:hypothetical protein
LGEVIGLRPAAGGFNLPGNVETGLLPLPTGGVAPLPNPGMKMTRSAENIVTADKMAALTKPTQTRPMVFCDL